LGRKPKRKYEKIWGKSKREKTLKMFSSASTCSPEKRIEENEDNKCPEHETADDKCPEKCAKNQC